MKKAIFLKVASVLSVLTLSALAISNADAATLNVLYSSSNLVVPVHEAYKKQFESTHPGNIVAFQPMFEYTDAIATTLRSQLVNALPDVGYYGISDVCMLAERGIAKPLDDLIKGDPEWSGLGMPDRALDVTKCSGVTYGIPFAASYMVIIFNKKLVAEAGGDPNNLPRTWPDILALARKIRSPSGGIAMSYMGSSSWSFMTLILSVGGKVLSSDGTDIAYDSPKGLQALQILADIGAARNHIDMSKTQARQAFNAGTLGILIDSSSSLRDYKKAAAEHFDIGVIPFPVSPNGGLPPSGMAGILLKNTSGHDTLAWDYLKYSSSVNGQTSVGRMTGFLPFNQSAIHSSDKLGDYYKQDPEIQIAAESAKNATAWPGFPGPNSLKIHQLNIDYMQKVYTGAIEPKAALSEMALKTRELLLK